MSAPCGAPPPGNGDWRHCSHGPWSPGVTLTCDEPPEDVTREGLMMVTIRVSLGWTGAHQDATTTMSTCQAKQTFEAAISLLRMMVTIRMSLGVHQDVTQYNADTTELLLTLACVSCVTPSLHLWAGSASDIWLYTPGHPGWPGPVSPVTIIVSSRHSAAMYSSYLWGMCLSDVNAS